MSSAWPIKSQIDLLKEGGRIVEELRDDTGETVQLSVLENDMMVVADEGGRNPADPHHQPGRLARAGQLGGRRAAARLGHAGREPLPRCSAREARQSPTGSAITDVTKLVAQIRQFREQGYATELNETNEHAGCVAAPVIDGSAPLRGRAQRRRARAAPGRRTTSRQLIAAVRDAAQRLSSRLGAR